MEIQELEGYLLRDYDVREQLKRFVYDRSNEAIAAGDLVRDAIINQQQMEDHKTRMREKFIAGLGGLPSSDTPLHARVTSTEKFAQFNMERIIFESRPQTYVTANLYIPDGITSPQGAVLFVCGHTREGKLAERYQTVCYYLVHAGLIVMAIDPIGQGERLSYYEPSLKVESIMWGTREHSYTGNQCWPLGDGIARYFLHDAMRAIDYLCTRKEVDPGKIGVTGNSGGGVQTSLLMLCDPRIAAAVPGTMIMNRKTYMYAGGGQDAEQIYPGMTAFGFDHEDILISMVPRPVMVLAAKYDFFPIEGTRRTVEITKIFW